MWPLIGLLAVIVAVLWWTGCSTRRTSGPPAVQPSPSAVTGDAGSEQGRGDGRHRERDTANESANGGGRGAGAAVDGERAAPESDWQPREPLLSKGAGRVAIIVDDVGYGDDALADFIAVGYPLTFSVLPELDDSEQLARACASAGFDVMLHLPMEPRSSGPNPGPGCVTVEMTDGEVTAMVERDLATVPGAIGVNNHMGSRATADERVMTAALKVLRKRGLFFVDSLTSGSTVGAEVAAKVGIPCAERNVFLDTNFDVDTDTDEQFFEAAQERVAQLGGIAQRRGAAIGICHYHTRTAEMLKRLLPALAASGVKLVRVSEVIGEAPRAPAGGGRTGPREDATPSGPRSSGEGTAAPVAPGQ